MSTEDYKLSGSRTLKFDVSALIADMGGASKIARITGKGRTTPYKWIEQGFVNTKILEAIKNQDAKFDVNKYFR